MILSLSELSDELLLEECRLGNVKAFDVLFSRYSTRLYHYALKYVHDEAVAEEAMMDLMLWVWEKRHQLAPDIYFAPYIYRAMKNAVIKILTRKSAVTLPLQETITCADGADNRILCEELDRAYAATLDELSSQRRLVYTLSRHEKMSHAEIAKEMNLSLFTVKNHIKASLSHFRRHLKDYVDMTTIVVLCFFMQ